MVLPLLVKSSVCFLNPMEFIFIPHRDPSTNGLAECAVQVFKSSVQKMNENVPIVLRITLFLARYHITPQTTTGHTPAELLMNNLPKTHLNLLRGNVEVCVHCKQHKQREYDRANKLRVFENGDLVFTHSAPVGNCKITWMPGIVRRATGPLSYKLEVEGLDIVKHHVDQIRRQYGKGIPGVSDGPGDSMDFPLSTVLQPSQDARLPEPVALQDDEISVEAPAVQEHASAVPLPSAVAKETYIQRLWNQL